MITSDEFKLFTKLVSDTGGICLKTSHMELLGNKVQKRMLKTGAATPYQYYRYLIDNGEEEILFFLDELTINETSFFRNRPQMDLFRNTILPEIVERKDREGIRVLRIWSAGCSTGEEPYSIAMHVNDMLHALHSFDEWDVKIFASDISFKALDIANNAVYEKDKVDPIIDEYYRAKYFDPIEGGYRLKDLIKKMVVFDYHNLKNENGLDDLDIIFCRNVMIYFDDEEQKRLIDKFVTSLCSGGYFFIGHAETLQGLNTGMKFICNNKGIAYKKSAI